MFSPLNSRLERSLPSTTAPAAASNHDDPSVGNLRSDRKKHGLTLGRGMQHQLATFRQKILQLAPWAERFIGAPATSLAPAGTHVTIPVDIGGKKYAITSDDNYLDHIRRGFEPAMVRLIKAVAQDADVSLDIGANIGCTAILCSELSRKVYAFEPSPTTYKFLEGNIASAGAKNVVTQNFGLGAEAGEFPLTYAQTNRSGGFVSNTTNASTGHTVEKISIRQLDEVLKSLPISKVDFIKIDVEGFEGHVLRGAKQTLTTHRPVVVLELNHWCLNAFQRTSIPDFFDQLRSLFPILLAIDGTRYLNLHDESDRYTVMYHHILHRKFQNLVGAFEAKQVDRLRSQFRAGFVAKTGHRK